MRGIRTNSSLPRCVGGMFTIFSVGIGGGTWVRASATGEALAPKNMLLTAKIVDKLIKRMLDQSASGKMNLWEPRA